MGLGVFMSSLFVKATKKMCSCGELGQQGGCFDINEGSSGEGELIVGGRGVRIKTNRGERQ
jgi:hypothetical protein